MFKFLSSLFGAKESNRPTNESDIIKYAENAFSGLGVYAANSMSDDWPKKRGGDVVAQYALLRGM